MWEIGGASRIAGGQPCPCTQPKTGGDSLLACGEVELSSLPTEPPGLWGAGLLTVPGLAPPPRVFCRWQVKISSARRRYLVIFSFTASHRSLLGSTVG